MLRAQQPPGSARSAEAFPTSWSEGSKAALVQGGAMPPRDMLPSARGSERMLVPRVIGTLSELEGQSSAWRDLLRESAAPQPTRTPLWLCTWWRVFGEQGGRTLKVMTFSEADGTLVALIPVLRRAVWHRRLLPFRRIELLATGEDQSDEILSEYVGPV